MGSTKLVKKSLFTKPYLLTAEELAQYGQDINLVGFDSQLNLTSDDSNTVLKYGVPSSPKILNWVEPYEIGGINYTLFFTEVNSGLNVGDKIFIINGTYDSNLLIQQNKYKKGHDGYKVLWIDRCKVVLDIVFTGSLPTNDYENSIDDFDELVKVYYLRDQNDFIQANRQVSTRDNNFGYKFGHNQNSIIYTDTNFLPITDNWGLSNAITDAPGFYIKSGENWENVTSDFISGSFSIAAVTASNDKILILNNSFQFNNNDFKENLVYYWNSMKGTYDVWVKHENKNIPILTRSNFRYGTFNGTWNGGVYGSNEKRIYWTSSTAIWNHGTLLNTIWKKGIMNSLYSQPESFIADYTFVGTYSTSPYQKSTNPDNDGYGYNFVINSEIINAEIKNANVSNSAIGATGSSASFYNIVEEHVNDRVTTQFLQDNFNNTLVNKALFESCEFRNSNIQNAVVRNSRGYNSRFYNVKSINTQFKKSVFKNSNYISDNVIKILDYREFNYSEVFQGTETHKVYKFYINKRSYEKFQFKDYFYIKGLVINDGSNNLINFFDKRLKIGPWREYVDIYDGSSYIKQGIDFDCFISTPKENQYDYAVDTTSSSGYQLVENLDSNYSIDIFVKYVPIISIDPNTAIFTSNSLRFVDIIDFSNAYISNSDFESGVFENSTWNSGNHINFNNDVIINNNSSVGGDYDIQIDGTQSLVVKTRSQGYELEQDYIKEGEIIFINGLDYDSRGKVTSLSISASGSNYMTYNNVTTFGGSGTGLTIDIVTQPIGAVYNFIIATAGSGFNTGLHTYGTIGGSGNNLTISLDNGSNPTIINPGSNYQVGDIVEIDRVSAVGSANNDFIEITSVSVGDIVSVTVSNTGLGYQIGDLINVSGGSDNAKLIVSGIEGSLTRLGDTYKVRSVVNANEVTLDEVSSNIISSLLSGGLFSTYNAKNRWGYLSKAKFYKSKIVSGIFRRAYFNTSLVKNDRYDLSDKDFGNIEKIKTLLVTDTLFSNVNNYTSNATYMNSFFVGGTDIWENGILYNSIWNGGIFNNGLVKQSTWVDGIFNDGLFYDNRTFDGNSTTEHANYYDNNISTYYIQGDSLFNNRYSWRNGTFLNGEFYKSDWENGNFNGGKFYYSKFYNGIINGGILGDLSVPEGTTIMYNGVVNYTTVESAYITSQPTNYISPNSSIIIWNNGIFNSGKFKAIEPTTNSAIWNNGIFNGGEFTQYAKWKNGIFNGGKFISYFGFNELITTSISNDKEKYSWEDGIFNGGEFGNAEFYSNSSWYKGIFNSGTFKGRLWNDGAFISGEFIGSYTQSVVGGTTGSIANLQVSNFSSNNFYGLWRSGYVTDTVDRYLSQEIYTGLPRSTDIIVLNNDAILRNILWLGGTFSHPAGLLQNSVWLNGAFEKGRFLRSSFNPYVKKLGFIGQEYGINSTNNLFNYNDDECYWLNGTFEDSEFFISKWYNGQFISGTATGMIWKNGAVNYMNAYNIFWEDGLWKNGNWYGSNFLTSGTGSIDDDFTRQILFRGMSWSGTASSHIWNVFYKENISDAQQSIVNDTIDFSWTPNLTLIDSVPVAPTYATGSYLDQSAGFTTIIWSPEMNGLDITDYYNNVVNINNTSGLTKNITFINNTVPVDGDVAILEYSEDNGSTWSAYSGNDFDLTVPTTTETVNIYTPSSAPYSYKFRLSATRNGNTLYSNTLTYNILLDYSISGISNVTRTSGTLVSPSTYQVIGFLTVYQTSSFNITLEVISNGSGSIKGSILIPTGVNGALVTYQTNGITTGSIQISVPIPAGVSGRQYTYYLRCITGTNNGEVKIY